MANIADLPKLTTVLMESPAGPIPYQGKAIAEIPNVPTAAAIANAVQDACGVRILDLPITAEKVYAGAEELATERLAAKNAKPITGCRGNPLWLPFRSKRCRQNTVPPARYAALDPAATNAALPTDRTLDSEFPNPRKCLGSRTRQIGWSL